ERQHLVLLRGADADAGPPVGMACRARLGIDRIQPIAAIDEQAAHAAELPPGVEELAVLVEDLDPMVATVGDEQPSARVERERVRRSELAGARTELPPFLDVLAVLAELDDPSVRIGRRIRVLPA